MSDNLLLSYEGRKSYSEFANFSYSSNTYGLDGFWLQAYNAILSTNSVIHQLEVENPFIGTDEEEQIKNILGECLVLRGYIHFDLVRSFGVAYKQATDHSLGVPYKTTTEVTAPGRNTVKEVYSLAVNDMKRGLEMMTDSYNKADNARLNKKAASALLARVCLSMGDDENAIKYATDAIVGDGSDLCKSEDFEAMFTTSMKVPEVLLRIAVVAADKLEPGTAWGQGSVTSYKAEYCVSYSFGALHRENDCRRSGIQKVALDSKSFLVPWKYNGRGGESLAGVVDIPLVRVAEMYLTRAEAYYNSEKPDLALIDLNYVRSKRYSGYTSGTETGQDLEDAIQLERRLELAFEGDRFYTIKRRGETLTRDSKGHYADGEGVGAVTLSVPATSPYFLMPIPQSEINANSNIQQNEY